MAELAMYTIYYNPSDFPDQYVVRRFLVTGGEDPVGDPEPLFVGDSVEVARDVVPAGCALIPRSDDDDPAIVESWV